MRLCERSYYHPDMDGRVGIKYVLKSIWQNTEKLWQDPWFSDYFKKDEAGKVLDPYMSLSAEPFAYASERTGLDLEVVREGLALCALIKKCFMVSIVEIKSSNGRNASCCFNIASSTQQQWS